MAVCYCPAVATLLVRYRSDTSKPLTSVRWQQQQRRLFIDGLPAQQGCFGLGRSKRRKRVVIARASAAGDVLERVAGAASYVLPLLDGMQYGRYVFAQYPISEVIFRPLFPLLRLYASIPYSNFVLFFTLYLAVVRNPSFGRFIRFNAMQACVLDVLIVLPIIVQRILNPRSGLGLDLLVILYNTIFIGLLAAVAFAMVSCLLGRIPRLPIVAEAADNQLF